MAPAIPCKRMKSKHPSVVKANAKRKIGDEKEFKALYGCKVESHESTRQRAESLVQDTCRSKFGKRIYFCDTLQLTRCTSLFRMQKPQWTMNGKNSRQFQHGTCEKVKSKRRSFWKNKETKRKSICFIDGHVSHQKCGVRTPITEVHRQSRAPGGKRRLWSLRSFSYVCSFIGNKGCFFH